MLEPARRSEPYSPSRRMKKNPKYQIKTILRDVPLLEPILRMTWRMSQSSLSRLRNLKAALRFQDLDVNKILWLSPDQIQYCSLSEFNPKMYSGKVISGDWDRLEKRFEDLDVYVAFEQVFFYDKPWPQTVFYQRILDRIESGEEMWGCTSREALDQRCAELENLFHRILSEGYMSQNQLNQEDPSNGGRDPEVVVSIGREGDLLFSESAHRLAIAKLLEIPQIPVQVAVRHPEWMSLRRSLRLYAAGQGRKVYQTIPHPDLTEFPAVHNPVDRFELIVKKMGAGSGKLLDLGANIGYFCHKFEELGFECTAVENSIRDLYFLKKLKRASNRKFKVAGTSTIEQEEIFDIQYDVVLALNLFRRSLRAKPNEEELIKLLGKLRMKELFFESPLPEEFQFFGANQPLSPTEFVDNLLEKTNLPKVDYLGALSDKRKLFRFYS